MLLKRAEALAVRGASTSALPQISQGMLGSTVGAGWLSEFERQNKRSRRKPVAVESMKLKACGMVARVVREICAGRKWPTLPLNAFAPFTRKICKVQTPY
jgi:hypothetical protein